MGRDEFVSVETELSAADQAAAAGQYAIAAGHLRRLLTQTRAGEYEYDEWCRRLADMLARLGRPRDAGFLHLYLHHFDTARASFAGAPAERARCLALEKRWADAAREFSGAGLRVQAAVAWEQAKQPGRAAEIWSALISEGRFGDRPYERALAHTNLGLAYLRAAAASGEGADRAVASRHLVASQRIIEQIADDFETAGERERAFDCYQVLLKLGMDSGSFENLSEGYLNCIRILKEDGLKTYVLQYYEDFLAQAVEREEFHAAATLYREVADYALRAGLPYHRHYLRRAAEAWAEQGGKMIAANGPLDLVENAYLAAVDCLSLVGDYGGVRGMYARLGELALGDRKKARYAAIAARFGRAPMSDPDQARFPDFLQKQRAYGDIWFVDLIEWEQDGEPEQVAAMIVGDLGYPDGIRRRALNLILDVAENRVRRQEKAPSSLAGVAELLGELQSYAALRPLEKLYEHGEPAVRRAAVTALKKLYFKRSFGLIAKALVDKDEVVRVAAIEAIRGLHFTHAFQPLSRIFREHPEEKARAAALESIGKIGSLEAGELLIGVIRHEAGPLRQRAVTALESFDNLDVLPVLEQHAVYEQDPATRKVLESLLQRRRAR